MAARQSLSCSICMEPFKEPTILMCGHTFCRACLVRHDEHNNNRDRITCPLCRGNTNLGQDRIAGLPPNLSLRDVQVELREDARELHCNHYYDLFCEVCEKFICPCELKDHEGHNIKKKDEMTKRLRNKQASLIQNSRAMVIDIERCVREAEKQRELIRCYFGNLEIQVVDEFAKKVAMLERDQEKLLKRLDHQFLELDEGMKMCIVELSYDIHRTDLSITYLTENTRDENLDSATLIEAYSHVRDLEKSSKLQYHENCFAQFIRAAERAKFHPADNMLLDLGHLEM